MVEMQLDDAGKALLEQVERFADAQLAAV